MAMKTIILEMRSFLRLEVDFVSCPPLSSKRPIVQKALRIMAERFPRLLNYLSRQRALALLPEHRIVIKTRGRWKERRVMRQLGFWLRRERIKKLFYMIVELLLMPLAGLMAVLPGPNVFFYGLFLLFYFHLQAYLGLRRIRSSGLDVTIMPLLSALNKGPESGGFDQEGGLS